jgi:hypothetical protein
MAKMETTSPPIFSKETSCGKYVWRYVFTYEHGVSSFATSKKESLLPGGDKGR